MVYEYLVFVLDFFLSLFFFGEYFLLLYISKKPISYLLSPRKIFDLVTAIPLFIEMVFIATGNNSIAPLQYIRLLKVFRILELFRYGEANLSVRVAVVALYRSMRQIYAALISLVVLLVTSSSFMFLVENHSFNELDFTWYRLVDGQLQKSSNSLTTSFISANSPFQSVPQTFYWAMVTLTTTGYGDQYPVTELGRLVAGITMMFGVAVIALPTSIIGTNLTYEWNSTLMYIKSKNASISSSKDTRIKDSIKEFTGSPYVDDEKVSSPSLPSLYPQSETTDSYLDDFSAPNTHSLSYSRQPESLSSASSNKNNSQLDLNSRFSNNDALNNSGGNICSNCANCSSLTSELKEIKSMLQQLLNKQSPN
ncbi:Potassium voltage-gated channel subfamily B member 1 [Smittium culicis]|uniref:Potassium voltage-gated channel subfamily B member 1 n=1 Tax=Smittium culicis TaxID=133412 RepID=A0A1R1XMS9_9FUNG|nr:Potassium voltage-gated channel subfamily B member 1 [Smittium culicis]OMJ24764.1 Potassium voltage-gated channel subfamily B member 1 [Smittium culicis]